MMIHWVLTYLGQKISLNYERKIGYLKKNFIKLLICYINKEIMKKDKKNIKYV